MRENMGSLLARSLLQEIEVSLLLPRMIIGGKLLGWDSLGLVLVRDGAVPHRYALPWSGVAWVRVPEAGQEPPLKIEINTGEHGFRMALNGEMGREMARPDDQTLIDLLTWLIDRNHLQATMQVVIDGEPDPASSRGTDGEEED